MSQDTDPPLAGDINGLMTASGATNDSYYILNTNTSSNISADENTSCRQDIPQSIALLKGQGYLGIIMLVVCLTALLVVLIIYIEEIRFCIKYFSGKTRKRRTIYILGLSPVFALCATLGVIMPRAGTLVDFVSNTYFAMVLNSLMCLMDDYMGGRSIVTSSGVTSVSLRTPPACCCCLCLPDVKFNRTTYRILLALVYQVTIVRPLLMFLAAVLWLDGAYIPGKISPRSAYIYIFVPNVISTMVAVWILVVMQKSFRPVLSRFRVLPKFLYIQLCLLGTIIGNITIAVLVSKDVVPCNDFIPSRARASRLYHSFVILWMFLVTIWGRFAFRRKEDGVRTLHSESVRDKSEKQALQAATPAGEQEQNTQSANGQGKVPLAELDASV